MSQTGMQAVFDPLESGGAASYDLPPGAWGASGLTAPRAISKGNP